MKQNILIVEDEAIISLETKRYLEQQNYNVVDICTNTTDAYKRAIKNDIDLIVMDIRLGSKDDEDGIDVALKLRKTKDTPIVFLTAFADDNTIERATEIKFINFLIKPYRRLELLASIKANIKHVKSDKYIILDNEFSFDTHTQNLIHNEKIVTLNNQQRKLLKFFLNKKEQLITHQAIEHEIWSDKPCSDSTRIALVSKLRTKLHGRFIETYSSEGYLLKIKS